MTIQELKNMGYVFYPEIKEEEHPPLNNDGDPTCTLTTVHVKKNDIGQYVAILHKDRFTVYPRGVPKNMEMMWFKLKALEVQARYKPSNNILRDNFWLRGEAVITDWKETDKRGVEE